MMIFLFLRMGTFWTIGGKERLNSMLMGRLVRFVILQYIFFLLNTLTRLAHVFHLSSPRHKELQSRHTYEQIQSRVYKTNIVSLMKTNLPEGTTYTN